MVTAIVILMKLLPVIASLFETTVDDLLDAQVTLDKQEIRIVYAHFAERFSKESFKTVFNDVKTKIKLYYDDENFLLQMGILLLNHAEFSKDANEIFAFVIQTLEWIEDLTTDVWIRRQVNMIISSTALFMQQPGIALERLTDSVHPYLGEEMVLAQAHDALDEQENARKVLQRMIYQQLVALIGSSYTTGRLNSTAQLSEKYPLIVII